MFNQIDSVKEYMSLKPDQRYAYLRLNVGSSTSLTADFCLNAYKVENDNYCKWYLLQALGVIGDPVAISTLIGVFSSSDVDLKQSSFYEIAAESLGLIGNQAFDATYELLNSSDVKVKCYASRVLGNLKDPRAIDGLCNLLRYDEAEVKYWAALSLSKIGIEALPCLTDTLKSSTNDKEVSLLALDAALKIDSVNIFPLIEWVLENGSIDQKRWFLSRGARVFWNDRIKELTSRIAENNDELSALAKEVISQMVSDSSKG